MDLVVFIPPWKSTCLIGRPRLHSTDLWTLLLNLYAGHPPFHFLHLIMKFSPELSAGSLPVAPTSSSDSSSLDAKLSSSS